MLRRQLLSKFLPDGLHAVAMSRRTWTTSVIIAALGCSSVRSFPSPPERPFDAVFLQVRRVGLDTTGGPPVAIVGGLALSNQFLLVDGGAADIRDVDARTGKLVRLIGSPGDEPGMFRRPISIAALSDSMYGVLDQRRQVVSIHDTQGVLIKELRIAGFWNSLARSMRPGHFAVAGNPDSARERPSILYEFDGNGKPTGGCGDPPKLDWDLESSFATPFTVRDSAVMLAGAYNSNLVRICDFNDHRTYTIAVAPGWYRPISWPTEIKGSGASAPLVNAWARKQRLFSALFSSGSEMFLAEFRSFARNGDEQFNYAVVDTSGHTLAITAATTKEILDTRGDSVYWIERTPTTIGQLGVSVFARPSSEAPRR
jgi:hypothetical protein